MGLMTFWNESVKFIPLPWVFIRGPIPLKLPQTYVICVYKKVLYCQSTHPGSKLNINFPGNVCAAPPPPPPTPLPPIGQSIQFIDLIFNCSFRSENSAIDDSCVPRVRLSLKIYYTNVIAKKTFENFAVVLFIIDT